MPTTSPADPEAEILCSEISPELRAIVELFTTELPKVTFPDVDAATLRREVDVVRARASEVQRAREAVAVAEAALAQRAEVLAQLAARGLAYARIYAEAHPDRDGLANKLAEIASPAARTVVAPMRRRGRPPKLARELPFERQSELVGDGGAATAPA